MIIIAFIGISIIILFNILLFTYKRKERKKINKKKHRLWFMYGLAMFIVDRIPQKIIEGNTKVNLALGELVVKEDTRRERYLYVVEKVSICILAIGVTLLLILVIGISEKTENKNIDTVVRSTSGDTEYNLEIEDKSGKKDQVTINVARKQYTKEQIEKIFDKRKDELLRKVLGKNKNQNKVNQNLNLVTSIGKENILVSWSISDSDKIDYDGVLSKNIAQKGEIIILTATMTLERKTCDYRFAVNVFPPEQKSDIGEKVQTYVDENEKYNEKVKLPKKLDGKEVTYQKITSNLNKYILPIGVIISIALFFLKDKDLKKEVEKRNQQMQNDYPEIVSKILLYYGTGLSMKGVIERIVKGYEEEKKNGEVVYRYAYEELSMCFIKMKSGVSELMAINEYGKRCKLHCYVKMAGLIEQNMRRGTQDLSLALKSELKEAMNEKKNMMLRSGGQISTKLLGPMVIMLIIAMVIIMVPAFMSMGF